ncbi:hypothetical protein HY78_02450 [Rhizorhabdus wittichii DC-6]|nr:hypothetical protein HY78_02450 [Rhizorhabdus wittichii DC-6]
MIDLMPHEKVLRGSWVKWAGQMMADGVCRRIDALINTRLQPIATRDAGWIKLFRDPQDDRLWEHSYPQGEMHGGGPPMLRWLSYDDVSVLYGPV